MLPATRIVAGTFREVWQGNLPIDGGMTMVVTTGIRAGATSLNRVFGILSLDTVAGTPNITATAAVVGGVLVATIHNTAGAGNSATWTLNILLTHSLQQASSFGSAAMIYVIGPGSATSPLVVESVAELRTWEGGTTGGSLKSAITKGYYAADDGGGTTFIWTTDTTTADNTGTVIVPTALPRTGCWKILNADPINIKWFGAIGGGGVQPGVNPVTNQTAILNAIAFGNANQRRVFCPSGIYMIYPGMDLTGYARVALEGDGTQWVNAPGTCFRIQVPAGQPSPAPYVAQFAGSPQVSHIWFDGAFVAKNTVQLAAQESQGVFDLCFFTDCWPISQQTVGPPDFPGWPYDYAYSNLLALAPGSNSQIDELTFRGCRFIQNFNGLAPHATYEGHAGYNNYFPGWPPDHSIGDAQALQIVFEDHCQFVGQRYGAHLANNGEAVFRDCTFYRIGVALWAFRNGGVWAYHCYTEPGGGTNTRIIEQDPLSTGGGAVLEDCQFNTAGDFYFNGTGRVRILGCGLNGNVNIVPAFPGTIQGAHLIAMNDFPVGGSIVCPASFPNLIKFGNRVFGSAVMESAQIPDVIFGQDATNRGRLSGNVSGVATITDPTTEVTVTFGTAEPDANYRVFLTADMEVTPASTPVLYYRNKTVNSFVIGVKAATGGGLTVTVPWLLVR